VLELSFQADFNDVIEVQANLIVEQDVHQSGAVEDNIGQPACVAVLVIRDDQDFLTDPLSQVNELVSLLLCLRHRTFSSLASFTWTCCR
jgi:hypothetical protein